MNATFYDYFSLQHYDDTFIVKLIYLSSFNIAYISEFW